METAIGRRKNEGADDDEKKTPSWREKKNKHFRNQANRDLNLKSVRRKSKIGKERRERERKTHKDTHTNTHTHETSMVA